MTTHNESPGADLDRSAWLDLAQRIADAERAKDKYPRPHEPTVDDLIATNLDALRRQEATRQRRKIHADRIKAFAVSNWRTLLIVTAILIAAGMICATMIATTPAPYAPRSHRVR